MLLDRRDRLDPLIVLALRAGLREVIANQIRKDVHVDARDSKARTALMIAAEFGHAEICRLLLLAGADPALRDGAGSTAYDIAREHGHAFSLELLADIPDCTVQTSSQAPPASVADESTGWEPEEVVWPPADDLDCKRTWEAIQQQIGEHEPKDSFGDWADIAFELPAVEEARIISAPTVSELVLLGLSSGRIFSEEVEAACAADFDEQASEVLPHLTRLLEGLELVIEDTPLHDPPASRRVEPGNEWLIAEILQCLADVLPRKSKPSYWRYSAPMKSAGNDFMGDQNKEPTLSGELTALYISQFGYHPPIGNRVVDEWGNGQSD